MSPGELNVATTVSKERLRKYIPNFLLKQRSLISHLGLAAGGTYARLHLLDAIGIRKSNQRRPSDSVRSILFVCFGNIMRSAMADRLMKQEVIDAGLQTEVKIASAGLHASAGREADPWAQQASADFGLSLVEHRAKPLTPEMVAEADCVFAMDFQNKAELLTLYPESEDKIFMLSAYGEEAWSGREIADPYLGDLESTRLCARRLQICIRNLMVSLFPSCSFFKQHFRANP